MSSSLASTLWPPTPISPETKDLISHFFHLVDLNDPDAGKILATEVFASDGILTSANGTFRGEKGAKMASIIMDLYSLNPGSSTFSPISFLPRRAIVLTDHESAEISNCRANAWKTVAFRHHTIEKAFPGDAEYKDLVLVGKVETRTKDNPAATTFTDFTARMVIEGTWEGKLRIKSYQAFVGTKTTT